MHEWDGRPVAKCDLEYQWAIRLSAKVDHILITTLEKEA